MGISTMRTCIECSKVYSDLRDTEECDTCYALVCAGCVVDDGTNSQTYCSEECRDRGE